MRPQILSTAHAQYMACVGKRLLGLTSRPKTQLSAGINRSRVACDGASRQMQSKTTALPALLGPDHLMQHLEQHNIQATLVQHVDISPDVQNIKSMLLITKSSDTPLSDLVSGSSHTAGAAAVLVVLLGHQKVDLSRVARHLGVSRRNVRLARPDEAAAVTGYEVGSIPPCGHRTALLTLVDQSVVDLCQQQQQHIYAGGGAPGCQLQMSVQQMYQALTSSSEMTAVTGVFAQQSIQQQQKEEEGKPSSSESSTQVVISGSNGHSSQASAAMHHDPDHHDYPSDVAGSSWLDLLPVPWSAGSTSVEIVGVIAQRRRMAKLLLFCSLVPESSPPLPAGGTAAYVRRLWRHPQHNTPAEVQLILGKTIERNLGREAAATLLDRLKVGAVVSVKGKVQQNPAALRQQQVGSSSSSSSSGVVLDVVVHELRVLHRNREVLARAVRAAQRQGHVEVNTAVGLMQLQTQQQQHQQQRQQQHQQQECLGLQDMDVPMTALDATEVGLVKGSKPWSKTQRSDSSSRSTATVSATSVSTFRDRQQQAAAVTDVMTSSAVPHLEQQYWRSAVSSDNVHWVSTLEDIQHMKQMVFTHSSSNSSHDKNVKGSSSSSSSDNIQEAADVCHHPGRAGAAAPPLVVGLDCEWKPYDKQSPSTPVALLQLATRQHVFLVDMLAVCQQRQQPAAASDWQLPQAADQEAINLGDSSISSSSDVSISCSPAESALGLFLFQLLTDPAIIKLGFGLPADLARLQQSYPHLPCFHPSAAAAAGLPCAPAAIPLVRHIDLLHLSRTAVPSLVKLPSLSLSRLVAALVGAPLDKSQQTSNWEQRPLSQQQKGYAAADVHVLTVLFDEVMRRWRTAGGNDQLLLEQCAVSSVAAKETIKS